MNIAQNIKLLRDEIMSVCKDCNRNPDDINLIAVTKNQESFVLPELANESVKFFGENRIEHMEMMCESFSDMDCHFIGRIQSRKLFNIVSSCTVIHSLSSIQHAEKINNICGKLNKKIKVFCQVSTGEEQKDGVFQDELPQLLECVKNSDNIELLGLMCMAPNISLCDDTVVRNCFREVRLLAEKYGINRLSMGMSSDWKIAIEEGATDIRIGTMLFL